MLTSPLPLHYLEIHIIFVMFWYLLKWVVESYSINYIFVTFQVEEFSTRVNIPYLASTVITPSDTAETKIVHSYIQQELLESTCGAVSSNILF
jgi:Na+/melibiose symporter-like transporter